ncbi:organic cation transporter protein isoform X2 [Procambarus clarkii]|uniref:organic cation transporter protein isoform X2 n=1 Tax=Procambarus clarkii TaxID=6728 RepID=UPI003744547B
MEQLLEHIGEFGVYQRRLFLLLSLPTIVVSMQKLAWVFLGARVDHRCRLWWEDDNATFTLDDDVANVSLPWDPHRQHYHQCYFWSEVSLEPLGRPNTSHVQPCDAMVYDTSEYRTSAVIDYELVCERAWLRATVQSVYMMGMLVGSYLFGDLSDRLGRKPVFLSALVLMVVVGVGQAIIPDYFAFTTLRFILGASLQGVFLVAYVMGMELVGKRRRVLVGVLAQAFYTIGFFTAAALAYMISSWRWLQVAMTLPALLFIPYYWIIPESTRWLITKGRTAEARNILENAAKVNKKTVTEDMMLQALEMSSGDKDAAKGNFLDLFRYPNLRKKTCNVFFNWFVNSGVYYGLSLNTGNLGGNAYLNFVISGMVELPAHVITILLLDRVGRRIPLCTFLVLGGLALVSTMFVPKDLSWLLITLAMAGKLCITASYAIIYVVTAEIFPTVVRNVGVGSSSMVARVGGALAPYINLLGDQWQPLPLLIFGSLACTAGLLALLLPETLGRHLPETIQDGENFSRKWKDSKESKAKPEAEQLQSLKENVQGLSPQAEERREKKDEEQLQALTEPQHQLFPQQNAPPTHTQIKNEYDQTLKMSDATI